MGNFSDKQIIIYSISLVLAIAIVGISIYCIFFQSNTNRPSVPYVGTENPVEPADKYEELKNNFGSSFTNTVRRSVTLSTEPQKADPNKEIVFTQNQVSVQAKDKYEINVNIPHINLPGSEIANINNEIDRVYGETVNNVIQSSQRMTIYTVDYVVYVNDDMLSLVIRSTIKEDYTEQKMMIKTYNYSFTTKKQLTLGDLIIRNNLDRDNVQNKIHEEIQKVITRNEELEANGYTVYKRYLSNNKYLLGNIDTYYIDQNGYLYLVFSYGNIKDVYVNEVDLVII